MEIIEKKSCIVCGILKPISEYYTHKRMADGHLNKCKDCCKVQSKERLLELRKDTEWVAKERHRQREKTKKISSGEKYTYGAKINIAYYDKYPEKKMAKMASHSIIRPKGKHGHHWSYNKQHYKDIIFISPIDHVQAHRYIIYDQERMMYRTKEGVLLDTKESHIEYINQFVEEKI